MKLIRISALWCSSCLVTYKNWQQLKQQYPNYEYEELDYDTDEIPYEIGDVLPIIIILKQGKEIDQIIGEQNIISYLKEKNYL